MGMRFGSLTVLFSLLSANCSGTAEPVGLTAQDNGSDLNLVMQQAVFLTLQTIGPGQFGEPVISSAAASFEGMTFPKAQNPGGPTQLYRFRAVADGTALITIPHDDGSAPFTVTFRCCAQ
jgi:hypothetical protein